MTNCLNMGTVTPLSLDNWSGEQPTCSCSDANCSIVHAIFVSFLGHVCKAHIDNFHLHFYLTSSIHVTTTGWLLYMVSSQHQQLQIGSFNDCGPTITQTTDTSLALLCLYPPPHPIYFSHHPHFSFEKPGCRPARVPYGISTSKFGGGPKVISGNIYRSLLLIPST